MTTVILCATGHWSHLSPMLTIGGSLRAEGYDPIVLTAADVEPVVRDAGLRHAGIGTEQSTIDEDLANPDRLAHEGAGRFAWDMGVLMLGRMRAQHEALATLLHADDNALVLFENMFFGALPMLLAAPGPRARFGVAAVGVQPLMVSSVDLGPFGAGIPPDTSFEGRQRNAAATASFQRDLLGSQQQTFEDILRDVGATKPAPFFLDAPVVVPERFMQCSIEELSYTRSDLPSGVSFVGALPSPHYAVQLPRWWSEPWQERPVVVVTQGTSANHDLSELIEPTLTALADEPVTVVVATASDALPAVRPSNAYIERIIPFGDLLARADVMVCSGGANTVQQALANAVPLVLAGLAEDKAEGNARAAATGAAIDLRTQRPEPDAIRDAVRAVLERPEHRAHALRLATAFRGRDALGAIGATVDEMIGTRPLQRRPRPAG